MQTEQQQIDTYIKNQKKFWGKAKCTHSLHRYDSGAKKYRLRFDALFGRGATRKIRHYKGPDGEKRRTVEIEIQ